MVDPGTGRLPLPRLTPSFPEPAHPDEPSHPATAGHEDGAPPGGGQQRPLLDAGYRYALSLSHHVQDAEDLVQEAWLRLCRSRGGVDHRNLLFTTIRNLFIDHCRRRGIVDFEQLGDADHLLADPVAPADGGARHDLAHWLGLLRPAEREVIFLHHAEGLTAREIARLTKRRRNTVLSLLHRAHQRLRQAADTQAGGSGAAMHGDSNVNVPPPSSFPPSE